MEWLLELDKSLFGYINQTWQTDWQNFLWPLWRNKLFWVPFYVFLLFFLVQNLRQKTWIILLGLTLTVVVTDTLSSQLLKKNIKRPRPCHLPASEQPVHLLIPRGSGYSFTSSHATNHFGVAAFLFVTLGTLLGRYRWWLIFWAATIAYAQVYVGVHYPMDVLSGGLLGWVIGRTIAKLTPHARCPMPP